MFMAMCKLLGSGQDTSTRFGIILSVAVAHQLECVEGVAVRQCAPMIESTQNTRGELNREFASLCRKRKKKLEF
jgi:hypothetical protein